MADEIIIPGGFDEWSQHRWDDFVIGTEHTVFEWCMIYTDSHPAAFLGDDSRTATAEMQDVRLTLLGARGSNEPGMRPHPTETDKGIWDDQVIYKTRNAVYQQLAEAIKGRQLDTKQVYLDDRPGELDPTLCILDSAPVLAIARRRGDYGGYIAALLKLLCEPDAARQPHRIKPSQRGGSKPAPFWAEARGVAMEWLTDEGCPAPGDGQQAVLERHIAQWLQDRGHEAGESTIRRHVAEWISERRAELGR
jgi:hypothetical protein